MDIEIGTVHGMQKLRNDVLNDHFELELNSKLLESGHGRRQLRLDKTSFCEHYESQLLRQSMLTDHQKEKFEEIQRAKSRLMHVNAVAGSGKTFLAVQVVIDTLKETAGQVLFIAPSLPLCFYFARWLGRRGSHDNISFPSLLDRLVILVPTMNFMKLVVHARHDRPIRALFGRDALRTPASKGGNTRTLRSYHLQRGRAISTLRAWHALSVSGTT